MSKEQTEEDKNKGGYALIETQTCLRKYILSNPTEEDKNKGDYALMKNVFWVLGGGKG